MEAVRESVQRGGTLAEPMRSAPEALPPMVVQMIAGGEETGGPRLDAEQDRRLVRGRGRGGGQGADLDLEPVMIVVVGIIVGFGVSSITPMFKIYDQIK